MRESNSKAEETGQKIGEAPEETFQAGDPPIIGRSAGLATSTRAGGMMCALVLASALCAAPMTSAGAQPSQSSGARPGNEIGTGMSLPRSDRASNLDSATTHSELAPNLPAPAAGDDIQTLLLAARRALVAGRTGEAQEALERAESRALDRSVPYGTERVAASEPLPAMLAQCRAALAAGDGAGAVRLIDEALPQAAAADIPR